MPSTDYDVAKYFEREWRLMKESRHPNIVLFLGLSRAPAPDNRIFIISEFIDNGNLRLYIHNKTKPFPWRLRISFATDIARALAYLHARKCIHRDLKGENLLVTSNGRLKITDFGFARIAARSVEESRRLTFCGTDSYMSPEIMMGDEFDLPTDIFSLGVIFCEIASRTLADDHHFKRSAPTFAIDASEVKSLVNPGCPADFVALCLECSSTNPASRPTTRQILQRLAIIEAEVLSHPNEDEGVNVGSIKFMTGARRPGPAPRIPSFGVGVGKDIRSRSGSPEDSDDELIEAVMGLSSVKVTNSWKTTDSGMLSLLPQPAIKADANTLGREPLLQHDSNLSSYSTTVLRGHSQHHTTTQPPSLSSILTIKPEHPTDGPDPSSPKQGGDSGNGSAITFAGDRPLENSQSVYSIASMDSYRTASSESVISGALATGGSSTIRSLTGNYTTPLVHRFTLLKPGAKPKKSAVTGALTAGASSDSGSWRPLDMIFSSGLLVAKCDICTKRLGWKPVLECDDCGLR